MELKTKLYILGMKDNFRGDKLVESIARNSLDYEVCWGIPISEVDQLSYFRNEQKSLFLYGRDLQSSEISCTLGHRAILLKAYQDCVDTAVILEDDVIVNNFNRLIENIGESNLQAQPTLTLLLADPRLCLTLKSLRANFKKRNYRIFSNPSPTSAYLLNSAAISSLVKLPDSHWQGVQADFPMIFSKVLNLVDASESQDSTPIVLAKVESTISKASPIRTNPARKNYSILRRVFSHTIPFSEKMRFGVRPLVYHFVGRSLAWRLREDRMPTE